MPRTENGGLIGTDNFSSQNLARGVYTLRAQFTANVRNLWPRSGSVFLGIAHNTSPYFSVYSFSSLGFGSKLANPATLPSAGAGGANEIAFAPNGRIAAVAHDGADYISAYPFSGSGFGTKYSSPATVPTGNGRSVTFSPSSNTVVFGHDASPFVSAYPIDNISGFGTKYADPATLPPGSVRGAAFSPNGNDIALGHAAGVYISVYPWNNGFGAKYSDHPSNYTASVTAVTNVKFNPSGNYLFASMISSTTLGGNRIERAYSFTSGTGFNAGFHDTNTDGLVAEYLGAASTRGEDAQDFDIHPTGGDVAFACSGNAPYIRSFKYDLTLGYTSYYTPPSVDAAGLASGVAFSPDGRYLAAAHATTPFITVWPWTVGTGYGTKLTNPVTLPTGTGNKVAWVVV